MKQSNIKIAVTGGIGSGKSTVCSIFKKLGYPVFSCDEIYAELFNSGKLTAELVKEFGDGVLNNSGGIDRKKLANCVFNDKDKLEKLNRITHPKIFEEMFLRSESFGGIVFFEVPLLFEGNYQNLFDGVVVVLREVEDRIISVAKRDNLSVDEIKNRIKSQYNYDNFDFAQYYVIHNCGKIGDLHAKIDNILLIITKDFNC